MNDDEIFDALCGLGRSQFGEVVLRSGVPTRHMPSSISPPADRAHALIIWTKQSADNRAKLILSLELARQGGGADREHGERQAHPRVFILPPMDTEGFIGREVEMQRLIDLLIDGPSPVGGRVVGVYGPPGVGKSGLVAHFAQTMQEHFPDGVLGVDLRGLRMQCMRFPVWQVLKVSR